MREDSTDVSSNEAALRESEARLELALSASGLGVWEWLLERDEFIYSPRAREICGFDPEMRLTRDIVAAVTHPDDFKFTSEQFLRALDPSEPDHSPYEYRVVRPDGEVRNVVAEGKAVFEHGPDGLKLIRYVGTLADVTEQRKLQQDLQQSNETLKLAIEAARLAVWQFDIAKNQLIMNPELKRILGFDPDRELTIDEVSARHHREDMEGVLAVARRAIEAGERRFEAEFRFFSPDGEMRWFLVRAQVTLSGAGAVEGVIGVLMDITERREGEERLRLLAREVDHRANNLLTIVQGTIALSKATSIEALKDVLVGRLQALARAHQLLSESRWEAADLRRIVEEELRPYTIGNPEQASLDGGRIALSAHPAQSIGMAVHELATNAAKYGALSLQTGGVRVSWRLTENEDSLELVWEETGGPKLKAPERRGLGLTMIERALSQAGGHAEFQWGEGGLVCRMTLPLDGVRQPQVD